MYDQIRFNFSNKLIKKMALEFYDICVEDIRARKVSAERTFHAMICAAVGGMIAKERRETLSPKNKKYCRGPERWLIT